MVFESPAAPEAPTRAARWAARKGRTRRISLIVAAVVVIGAVAAGAAVAVSNGSASGGAVDPPNLAAAHPTSTRRTTTSKPTTTTTIPPIRQPHEVPLPPVPANGISWGSSGPVTLAYEQRLKNLHFDPGPVDGVYSQDTAYAVTAVEKLLGLKRDGVIGPRVRLGLEHFKFHAALPKSEGNRVEIDLDTQVLTVFANWQPILITTTSTGSGDHFCGGTDGCQYAITPTGHFHFEYLHRGWDKGKLGRMWNPYYFNGGIAVHGLASVPSYPASHGCARIPLDIANYFPSLVTKGESVYVVGTAMKPGNGYIGPAPTTTSTTVPKTSTTRRRTTTTVHHPTTTAPGSTTTAPHTTTSHGSSTT
jgi:peptidoglycan hydrolase-like protein with peptidoglycan-binding domain